DPKDRHFLAVALLDPASSLRAVLERDDLVGPIPANDLRLDGGVGDDRPGVRGLVTVGDEQHAIERDRVAGSGLEQLDLELGPDLDAILLPAGLDDCVHGTLRTGAAVVAVVADRDDGHGEAPGWTKRERGVYGRTRRSVNRAASRVVAQFESTIWTASGRPSGLARVQKLGPAQ